MDFDVGISKFMLCKLSSNVCFPDFVPNGEITQLMVNCWFGLVVWDSGGTPKYNPFHGIPGIQTTNPDQQLTIS